MRIGRIEKVEEYPIAIPVRTPSVPVRTPEKVPVRVPVKVPEKVLVRQSLGRTFGKIGLTVEKIPYACPYDGRELILEDEALYCPVHGIVYQGGFTPE